jgi:hypothetical protein
MVSTSGSDESDVRHGVLDATDERGDGPDEAENEAKGGHLFLMSLADCR